MSPAFVSVTDKHPPVSPPLAHNANGRRNTPKSSYSPTLKTHISQSGEPFFTVVLFLDQSQPTKALPTNALPTTPMDHPCKDVESIRYSRGEEYSGQESKIIVMVSNSDLAVSRK